MLTPPRSTQIWQSGVAGSFMYSYPAEGEGRTWTQGLTRRILATDLAQAWRDKADGCKQCATTALEDPCVGLCIQALGIDQLTKVFNDVAGDLTKYPNYGVPGSTGIFYAPNTDFCIDLSGGNAAWRTPIHLWRCNGLVNQAWVLNGSSIILAGSNYPGKCIDLPGGDTRNGNQIWLWECNGATSQQWGWDPTAQRIYFLTNNKYCLDLPGGAVENGNVLQLWECNGLDSQKWRLSQHLLQAHRGPQADAAGNKAVPVPWMHGLLQTVHRSGAHATGHTHATRGRNQSVDVWYERRAVREWYAQQAPSLRSPPLASPNALREVTAEVTAEVMAEVTAEVKEEGTAKVKEEAVRKETTVHHSVPHGAGVGSRLSGDTSLASALNGMIASSPNGDYRGGRQRHPHSHARLPRAGRQHSKVKPDRLDCRGPGVLPAQRHGCAEHPLPFLWRRERRSHVPKLWQHGVRQGIVLCSGRGVGRAGTVELCAVGVRGRQQHGCDDPGL